MSSQLDIAAISGICGSISIACWVVVFTPQIVENFRRSSADGLSIVFIVIWLAGDIFNILGAVLQGVLPTMIILALYYTFADIVLMLQCFYYRGFTLRDTIAEEPEPAPSVPRETSALLVHHRRSSSNDSRRSSFLTSVDGTHLSPATPLHPKRNLNALTARNLASRKSLLKAALFNAMAILVVCAAGILGWWISARSSKQNHKDDGDETEIQHESELQFNILGQVFGYICAVLYLGSRVPQLLLNYRRKSTEGISMLFFMFACLGNLTYVLSIIVYEPICHHPGHCRPGEAGRIYGKYFLVNLSWLIGSFGTLFLDGAVFVQYFTYRDNQKDVGDEQAIAD